MGLAGQCYIESSSYLGGFAITGNCPGQDSRNIRSAMYKCESCGNLVEIFSDESRFRCKQCGHYVNREKTISCIEWCPSARQCLGEDRWRKMTGQEESKEGK